jgi:hypothetical protein
MQIATAVQTLLSSNKKAPHMHKFLLLKRAEQNRVMEQVKLQQTRRCLRDANCDGHAVIPENQEEQQDAMQRNAISITSIVSDKTKRDDARIQGSIIPEVVLPPLLQGKIENHQQLRKQRQQQR